jgi:hypothetical protein
MHGICFGIEGACLSSSTSWKALGPLRQLLGKPLKKTECLPLVPLAIVCFSLFSSLLVLGVGPTSWLLAWPQHCEHKLGNIHRIKVSLLEPR